MNLSLSREVEAKRAAQGARFGRATDMMAAGEGVETIQSLRQVALELPAVAALSAAHLTALILPSTLRRLYIVEDVDPAGRNGGNQLVARAAAAGVEPIRLRPTMGDFNDDLVRIGRERLATALRVQFAPEDVARRLVVDNAAGTRRRVA